MIIVIKSWRFDYESSVQFVYSAYLLSRSPQIVISFFVGVSWCAYFNLWWLRLVLVIENVFCFTYYCITWARILSTSFISFASLPIVPIVDYILSVLILYWISLRTLSIYLIPSESWPLSPFVFIFCPFIEEI